MGIEASTSWYSSTVAPELLQGDILIDFEAPWVNWDEDAMSYQMMATQGSYAVITQSCDIRKRTHTHILLARAIPWSVALKEFSSGHLATTEYQKNLKSGSALADFLLPPFPGDLDERGFHLVSFRAILAVPKAGVLAHAPRVSMAPPYREHLAQAFARFMMRVGLPSNLHSETLR